jgi:hypothetical protein
MRHVTCAHPIVIPDDMPVPIVDIMRTTMLVVSTCLSVAIVMVYFNVMSWGHVCCWMNGW